MGKAGKSVSSMFNMFKMFGGKGGSGWIFGLLILAALFKKKKKPQAETPAVSNYESPTYSFGGGAATAVPAENAPIPLVFGHHIVPGNIVNSFLTTQVNTTKRKVVIGDGNAAIQLISFDNTTKTSIYKVSATAITQMDVRFQLLYNTNLIPGGFGRTTKNTNYNDLFEVYYSTDGATYTTSPAYTIQLSQVSYSNQLQRDTLNRFTGSFIVASATTTHYFWIKYKPSTIGIVSPTGKATKTSLNLSNNLYAPSVIGAAYTEDIIIANPAVNAQTLYMDVVLSAGEIRNVRNVWLNDKLIEEHHIGAADGEIIKGTDWSWKPGWDAVPLWNLDTLITKQSTIYNQNDFKVEKIVGAIVSQEAAAGQNRIYLDSITPFTIGMALSMAEDRIASMGCTVIATGITYIDLNTNLVGIIKAGTPIYIQLAETPTYTNFQYTTVGEYIDGIDVGLNCPNGLYTTNQNTGGVINRDVAVEIWAAPYQITATATAAFPLSAYNGLVASGTNTPLLSYHKTITLAGAKRSKLWFNQTFDKNHLRPDSTYANKKFLVEIRKTTDNQLSDYAKNDIEVSYVEELIDRDIVYAGCAYASIGLAANSKINTTAPSLKFELEGLLVPQPLPDSLLINTASSTTTVIRTKLDPALDTDPNYTTSSTTYQLSSICIPTSGTQGTLLSLLPDQSMYYSETATGFLQQKYNNSHILDEGSIFIPGWVIASNYYFRAYFKCGIKWYRRYVTIERELFGASATNPEHYRSKFSIFNPTTESTHPITIKDTDWLAQTNVALPSVPTDMIYYLWSDNPAWVILYLLLNEENAVGISLADIDLDSFKDAANYFDEWIDNPITSLPGDMIQRCSVNLVIDNLAEARQHIEKILTICHGALYDSNLGIKLLVEKAVEDVDIITSINEDDDLTSLTVTSIPNKDIPNQIVASFLDESDKFEKKTITIEDSQLSKSNGYAQVRRQELDFYGLTNESLVMIEAMKMIKTGRYVNYAIQMKGALSPLELEVYDVFKLTSLTYGWTDKKFRVVDVKTSETKEVEISALEYFAEIFTLEDDDLIKYHEVRHTELPNIYTAPNAVENITLTEENVRLSSGDIQINLNGHFNAPHTGVTFDASGTNTLYSKYEYNKISHYLVSLLVYQAGMFHRIRENIRFDGDSFRFTGLDLGTYCTTIAAVSNANAIGQPIKSSNITLAGKLLPPEDVTGLTITSATDDPERITVSWDAVSDADLDRYILKVGSSTNTYANAPFTKDVPGNTTSAELTFYKTCGLGVSAGDFGCDTRAYNFFLKAKDTSGNVSVDAASVTQTVTLEPAEPISIICTSTSGNSDYPLTINWDSGSAEKQLQYQVLLGTATTAIGDCVGYAYQADTTLKITDFDKVKLSSLFTYTGNLKIYIRALDKHGNYSTYASSTYALDVNPPSVTNLSMTSQFDVNGHVSIQYDEVNRSTTPDILGTEVCGGFVLTPASATFTRYNINGWMLVNIDTYDHEGETCKLFARYVDKYGNFSSNYASASHVVNVIPAHVSATDVSVVATLAQINMKLPLNTESCFAGYEIHVSEVASFTPDATTLATIGKQNQVQIKEFGTPKIVVADSTDYYFQVRALSVVGNGTNNNYNTAWSAEFTATTLDSTEPILIITSTIPSTSPINVINGTSATVYYDVSDNYSVDRVYGRCYIVGTNPPPAYTEYTVAQFGSATFSPVGVDGDYIVQLKAYDVSSNMTSTNYYFSKDVVVAAPPTSVSATQLSSGGIQVIITPATNINFKEYVVEYSVNGSAYTELRRTTTTLFIENISLVGTLQFKVKVSKVHDVALDSAYTTSNELTLDLVGPSIVADSATPDIFASPLLTADAVTFHYQAEDSAALNPDSCVKYSLDSSAYTTATTTILNASGTIATGTVVLTGQTDGLHYFGLRATDASGNIGNSGTYYFQVDTVVPADNDSSVGSISAGSRTITWNIPNFSSCIYYSNTNWMIYYTSGSVEYASATAYGEALTYTFTEDVRVFVKSRQVKSNSVARTFASCSNSSSDVWIDVTAPVLNIHYPTDIDSGNFCKISPINIIACATDTGGSGIAGIWYSIDGGSYTGCTATNGTNTSVALGASSTSKSVKFKAVDNAGNLTVVEKTFCLDLTAPVNFGSSNISSKFGRTIVWTMDLSTATDSTSGVSGIEVRATATGFGAPGYLYKGAEVTYTQYPSVSTDTALIFSVYDRAGNYGTACSSTAVNLAPAMAYTATGTGEINSGAFSWAATTSSTDGTVADDIIGYDYHAAYANAAGTFTASSSVIFTAAQEIYVPIPLALLLPSGANSVKIFTKARDIWGSTSVEWTSSTAVTTRRIEAADLGNNAFQFRVKSVTEAGVTTVSQSTNASETLDTTLLLLVDGNFDNEA